VRERKNMIKAQLRQCLENKRPSGRPIRVLSIAAGPAQETYELLQEIERIEHPVEIVLFEQDKGALTYSYSRLNRVVASRGSDRVKVTYLHDSIKRLLRDPRLFSTFGEFDFVFSCGLFDYLQHRTAASLAGSLYGNLAKGGSVLIGNMTPANPSRWFMELHLDWYLIYREHEEILAFARAGAPSAQLAMVEEATGVNPFVRLTRD
jgi:extracellular factor (EF) 3-hydroxypalmitic acid methyl ester biosynthesis protein